MLDDLDSLLLFPEAFAVLVLGKAYAVARSALVPTVVRNDAELVEANSKLQLLSGLAAPPPALLAAPAYADRRSQGVLALAVVVYAVGTVAALRIPTTQVAVAPRSARPRRPSSAASAWCWPRRPWACSAGSSAS